MKFNPAGTVFPDSGAREERNHTHKPRWLHGWFNAARLSGSAAWLADTSTSRVLTTCTDWWPMGGRN
jgi:hypothetical protein